MVHVIGLGSIFGFLIDLEVEAEWGEIEKPVITDRFLAILGQLLQRPWVRILLSFCSLIIVCIYVSQSFCFIITSLAES